MAVLSMLVGWSTADMAPAHSPSPNPVVSFQVGDKPGNWFTCMNTSNSQTLGCVPEALGGIGQKSLAVIHPGETVAFPSYGGGARTIHTAAPLLYPTGGAPTSGGSPFKAILDPHAPPIVNTVTLSEPGLYVFFCDIHVYMFAAVIVDETLADGLQLGKTIDLPHVLATGVSGLPTASNLALRLVNAFFLITNPNNWQYFPLSGTATWAPTYPDLPVPIQVSTNGVDYDVTVPAHGLGGVIGPIFGIPVGGAQLAAPVPPAEKGVGEVWVNTQFETQGEKFKPGTATAVNADSWKVEKKFGLPEINMNNPHNMWTDRDQSVIYQTQWFDEKLTVFDRKTGALLRDLYAGPAPSHVMTRANNEQVHVAQNGGNNVREFDKLANNNNVLRDISMGSWGKDTHPHAHWMSAEGTTMVTPNENVNKSTVYDFPSNTITATPSTGHSPIATGMMPNGSKYYVANFLDSSLTVIKKNDTGVYEADPNPINLLGGYQPGNPVNTVVNQIDGLVYVGALPVQTPVSPDGKYVVTANALTGTITIVDTDTDKVVAMLPCDVGCHGVQFGAKLGGGYYAYISNKFSNRMQVVDMDGTATGPGAFALTNEGKPGPCVPGKPCIAGSVLLTEENKTSVGYKKDGTVIGNDGMGGQGIMPIPNVYNGWVQQWVNSCTTRDCKTWKGQLTAEQKNPGTVSGLKPPKGKN